MEKDAMKIRGIILYVVFNYLSQNVTMLEIMRAPEKNKALDI